MPRQKNSPSIWMQVRTNILKMWQTKMLNWTTLVLVLSMLTAAVANANQSQCLVKQNTLPHERSSIDAVTNILTNRKQINWIVYDNAKNKCHRSEERLALVKTISQRENRMRCCVCVYGTVRCAHKWIWFEHPIFIQFVFIHRNGAKMCYWQFNSNRLYGAITREFIEFWDAFKSASDPFIRNSYSFAHSLAHSGHSHGFGFGANHLRMFILYWHRWRKYDGAKVH